MYCNVVGNLTIRKYLHPENAYAGILVTPSGTVMFVSLVQPAKIEDFASYVVVLLQLAG